MYQVVAVIGGTPVSLGVAFAAAGLVAVVAVAAALIAGRAARRAGREAETQFAAFVRAQSEQSGRLQTMVEIMGKRHSELTSAVSERLDGLGHRIGQSMNETTRSTHESLSKLHERLAVIDRAQSNITELSSQMVELQNILANKQTRGAFGQARMEAIVQDGLPQGSFSFQATLSNRCRPDCLVYFPNGAPALVIDSKFPLEAWSALKAEDLAAQRRAETQFRQDVRTHITAIRERYFLAGETQDTAFMFVPSESIFADIHERFDDLVQFAHRSRVVIVSPSLLMLSIQVIQAVLRDTRIKEQAHVVRDEVIRLMDDIGRLDDRVRKLQNHFGQANRDIDDILVSTRKIANRGERIDGLDFGDPSPREQELRLAGE
jgi:DNA recombination protein RmuC